MATTATAEPLTTKTIARGNALSVALVLALSDLFAIFLASALALLLRIAFGGQFEISEYLPLLPSLGLFLLVYALVGLYPGIAMSPVEEFRRVAQATAIAFLVVISITFLQKNSASYSRLAIMMALPLSIAGVITFRGLIRASCARCSWYGVSVAMLGGGTAGRLVYDTLHRHRTLGLKVAAVLDDDNLKLHPFAGETGIVLGGFSAASAVAERYGIQYAIIAMPETHGEDLRRLVARYVASYNHILIIPDLFHFGSLWVTARDLGGILGLELSQTLAHRVPKTLKRAFDLVLAVSGVLAITPLLLLTMLLVKLTSRGPIFFGHERLGRDGRTFKAWKFRSMYSDADAHLERYLQAHPQLRNEWLDCQKLRHDPRITPLGRFMRRTSIDELPQLWNVIRNEMSLVGPRPIVEQEIERYGDSLDLYLKVSPGLTGLWQVSGRSNTSYGERVRLDEYYVRNWSLWLDIYIIGRTFRTLVLGDGAY